MVVELHTSAALQSGKNCTAYRGAWLTPIAGLDVLEESTPIILTGIRNLNRPARSLFATSTHNNKNSKNIVLFMSLLTTLVAAAVPPGQFCRVPGEAFVHMQRQ